MALLWGLWACVNAGVFLLYGADKRRARKGEWRIPERTLLLIAVLGGSLGALAGMYAFHHKTKHPKFYITLPILLGIHLLILAWWYLR